MEQKKFHIDKEVDQPKLPRVDRFFNSDPRKRNEFLLRLESVLQRKPPLIVHPYTHEWDEIPACSAPVRLKNCREKFR